MSSITEDNLARDVLDDFLEARRTGISSHKIETAKINGNIRIACHKFGQSFLTLIGKVTNRTEKINSDGLKKKKKANTTKGSEIVRGGLGKISKGGGLNVIYDSIREVFLETKQHFHKPDEIDRRMRETFISNIPNAPPLTEQENSLFQSLGELAEEFFKNAKR